MNIISAGEHTVNGLFLTFHSQTSLQNLGWHSEVGFVASTYAGPERRGSFTGQHQDR